MASAADMREWAREQGMEVPRRGGVGRAVREAYEMAHPDQAGATLAVAAGDYPGPEDFGPTAYGEPPEAPGGALGDPPPPPELGTEVRPTRPGSGRPRAAGRGRGAAPARPGGGGIRGLFRRGGQAGGGRGRKPRVPTDNMLAGAWRLMAKLATPLPPLHRTLRIQAPVAGRLLEDTVKGTAIDVVLQPFARMAGQGRVAGALLGPPVIVSALHLHMAQRAAAGLEPSPLVMSAGLEALRGALMVMMEVAGPAFEQAAKREMEFEEKHGASVDQLIAFLLAPPALTAEEKAEEDAAIRRAQGFAEAA